MPGVPPRIATVDDLAALPDEVSAELVGGRLLPLPLPSFEHEDAVATLSELLAPYRSRRAGGPGGWWLASKADLQLDPHEVHCADLAGWRWERHPSRPRGAPLLARPDWVCEVISPGTARRDRVEKPRALHRVGLPHYWLLDPAERTLSVMRWHPEGWLTVLLAADEERMRVEPFDGLTLCVAELFAGSGGGESRSASEAR